MSKHFEVTTPRPLGQRHTVNSEQAAASLERIAAKVAEMIAPTIAEAVGKELQAQGVATNGSNGRKIRADDLTSRYQLPKGDEWDTLPPGDDAPARGGDHFANLPTD